MVLDNWVEYARQILNFAGHGYEHYCPIIIPIKKSDKVEQIDKKILAKYPLCQYTKDQRYRAKKLFLANYIYLRWGCNAIIMHSTGQNHIVQDPDKFYNLSETPYMFKVGDWVSIKIYRAKTGKKYTAYLTKQSYRDIKALLRENIEHKQWDIFEKHYNRLSSLPAFSGILTQMNELYRFCKVELKTKAPISIKKLSLKKVY